MKLILYIILALFAVSLSFSENLWDLYQKREKIESYLDYPANSRLIFAPTAFTAGSRTFVFSNRELMNSEMAYGIANQIQLSTGFILIPAYSVLGNFTAKYRFIDFANDNVHIATFCSIVGSAGFTNFSGEQPPENIEEIEEFWGYQNTKIHYMPGMVATFGNEYHNFNISGSVKLSKNLEQYYFISAGGALSIIKNVKLIADFVYIPEGLYADGLGGVALRYYTERYSGDAGIAFLGSQAIPYIQLMFTPKI